jgi:hypothetical protein
MALNDPDIDLDRLQRQLDAAADRLAGTVFGLDEGREDCIRLADRYEDFAGRMAVEYPLLAGPAARLGELFIDLNEVLGRLSKTTEELTASAGLLADRVAAIRA